MKAKTIEIQPALPLGEGADAAQSAGRMAGLMGRDVAVDAARFSALMEFGADRPGASLGDALKGALGTLSPAEHDAVSAATGLVAGLAPGSLPAPAPVTAGAPGARPNTPEAPETPGMPGMAEASAGPELVLTPAQMHAHALKRRALGLGSGLAHSQRFEAPRSPVAREKSSALDGAVAAAGVLPPQPPVQLAQPNSASTTTGAVVPPAAKQANGAKEVPAARGVAAQRAPAPGDIDSAGDASPAAAKPANGMPDQVQNVAGVSGAPLEAGALPAQDGPPQALALAPAPVPVPAKAAPELESSAAAEQEAAIRGESTDKPGAPPAPIRLEREQQVAQAMGAEIQAQAVHIALANIPESLPIELLKAV